MDPKDGEEYEIIHDNDIETIGDHCYDIRRIGAFDDHTYDQDFKKPNKNDLFDMSAVE